MGAQNVYSGIWSPSNEARAAWITSDWDDFTSKWGEFEKDGLRMYDYEVYLEGSTPVYVGLFRAGTGGTGAWFTSDWNDFISQWGKFEHDGLRMHDFETYVVDGVRWYAGIFSEGTGGYATAILSDWNQFSSVWAAYAENDCATSWGTTIPMLAGSSDPDTHQIYSNYAAYLSNTSCNQNGAGTPASKWWGSESDVIKVSPGAFVERGQIIGKSGATGPGGCGCANGGSGPNTHLHIFFAHRDPTDNRWYTFDPYGIYSTPDCYPTHDNADGASSATSCARYPVAWLGGYPQLPEPPPAARIFKKGDANDDGKLDISDAISLLGCKFLGAECPHCDDAADSNDDGRLDLSDAIFTLTCLFQRQCADLSSPSCRSETLRLGCRQYEACPVIGPR